MLKYGGYCANTISGMDSKSDKTVSGIDRTSKKCKIAKMAILEKVVPLSIIWIVIVNK